MENCIVTTGKTIDLAIQSALEQLKLDRDSVTVEVLENAKSGFLGFGACPAKVKVTYEVPDPKPALSSASRSKPKKAAEPAAAVQTAPKTPAAPKVPAPTEVKMPDVPKQAEAAAPAERPQRPVHARQERPAPQPRERTEAPKAPKTPKTYAPAAPGSVEEQIEQFLTGLLQHMGSTAVPHAWKDEEEIYRVELVGEGLGMLIGRRGETLDAIQHLTNYAVGRKSESRLRISVDAEEYRVKREESLRRYARKKAQQVLKMRRRTTLEPMNAYERHVIHATLQEMENITTYSTGTEPNRRVVVEYVR